MNQRICEYELCEQQIPYFTRIDALYCCRSHKQLAYLKRLETTARGKIGVNNE